MKIELPVDFLSIIRDKHVLLDTNIFIDAFSYPTEFANFFDKLKGDGCNATLVTLDVVLLEFLKGSAVESKLIAKKEFINNIVEVYLPITHDYTSLAEDLLKVYKIEGKDLSITDLFLGSTLYKYKNSICLLTRDLSDFPANIFKRISFFNLLKRRTIQTYGAYCT